MMDQMVADDPSSVAGRCETVGLARKLQLGPKHEEVVHAISRADVKSLKPSRVHATKACPSRPKCQQGHKFTGIWKVAPAKAAAAGASTPGHLRRSVKSRIIVEQTDGYATSVQDTNNST